MSQNADNLFVEQYNSMVTHAFQPQGFILQGMFTPQGKIVGKKAYWPTFGRAKANEVTRFVELALDNPAASQVSADLRTWGHLGGVADFDGERMEANEMQALTKAAAMGLGREIDLACIALLEAQAPTSGTGFINAGAAQLTSAQIQLGLAAWVDTNNIPTDGQLYAGISMNAHQQLMSDSSYSNSEWVGPDLPFKTNGVAQGRTWNFVNWVILPAEYLPRPSASTMDCYIWHKPSIGWTMNKQATSEWGRDIKLGAWLVRHEAAGCGIALRPNAVMRLRIKTDLTTLTKV